MSAQLQTMSTRASIMLPGEQSTESTCTGRENGARLILGWAALMLTFTAADQVHTLPDAWGLRYGTIPSGTTHGRFHTAVQVARCLLTWRSRRPSHSIGDVRHTCGRHIGYTSSMKGERRLWLRR